MISIDMQIYETEKKVDVSHPCVFDWYKKFRTICSAAINNEPIVLWNTDGAVVEIDEMTVYWERRGSTIEVQRNRTFGFVHDPKGNQKSVIKVVERLSRDTILPIIKSSVAEGKTIRSNCWAAYSTL